MENDYHFVVTDVQILGISDRADSWGKTGRWLTDPRLVHWERLIALDRAWDIY